MKQKLIDHGSGLHVTAAAVLVALGSSAARAQEAGQQEADRPQTEQSQRQDPLSESRSQDTTQQESDISAAAGDTESGSSVLDQIAQEHEDLSTFVEAVKAAGMEESLTGGTEYTVFAPTNDAWEQMSGLSTEELMRPENREQLVSLLRAHIVADDVDETMARSLPQAQTIDGGTVDLSSDGDELRVGDATVVESGIQQGSLRVYAIDQVLEPTALARADTSDQTESESGSQLDTESESDSPFDTQSDREGRPPLDTQAERDRDDPFGTAPQR